MMLSPHPLGLACLTFLDMPPPQFVDLAADAGYEAVGLRVGAARRGDTLFPMLGDSMLRRETLDRLRSRGLSVLDVEVVCLYPDTKPEDFLPMFEAAAELGAQIAICNSEDPDDARMAATLNSLCRLAEPFKLTLGLEFMRYRKIRDLKQAERLRRAVDAVNIGLVIDMLHAARTNTMPSDLAALPAEGVALIQISDAPADAPTSDIALRDEALGGRLAPGTGDLPLKAYLDALPAGIPISVEVPTREVVVRHDHARSIAEATRSLLTSPWSRTHTGADGSLGVLPRTMPTRACASS